MEDQAKERSDRREGKGSGAVTIAFMIKTPAVAIGVTPTAGDTSFRVGRRAICKPTIC